MKGRWLYSLCITLLLPWALLHLWLRSRKQPDYLAHIGERFARYLNPANTKKLIWIHAVSVGETRAAETLIDALNKQYPEHKILLTHMTPTGRAVCSPTLDTCERVYLPYDTPLAVTRFLRHFQPSIGLIMETELWPNLVAQCKTLGIPLLLVNARLSDKSARRYARFPNLTRLTLQNLRLIAAQTSADAKRLTELGASDVYILGNLKFDLNIAEAQLTLADQWRKAIGSRPIFLCASTREGEEKLIFDAWQVTHRPDHALLVITPRHPQRFAEVAQLAHASGWVTALRSQALPDPTTQVWIGDSMGEMAAYYALADLAFIGGSLLDYGSQNLIEACAIGTPVLLGPSTYNFAQAAEDALSAGAALQIIDATDLVDTACKTLRDEAQLAAMSSAGKDFAMAHQGATARTIALMNKVMPN